MKLFFVEYEYKSSKAHSYNAIVMATCELMARAELYNSVGDMDVIVITACEESKHKVFTV